MKQLMATVLWVLPVLPVAAWAGPFDGTWVGDVATSTVEGKPDTYLLQDGVYTCDACYPQLKIPADGKPHKVTGHSYYDEASATIVSPQALAVKLTLAGRKSADRTLTVSADGNTMTEDFVDYTGSKPAPAKFVNKRVKAGPAGAHAISGSWQQDTKNSTMSADLITVTYKETADGLKMSTPTGLAYDAKFDGKEYLTTGDPGKTMVTLERLSPTKIRETDKRKGKISDVITTEVSSDGKSLHVVDDQPLYGQKITYTAHKQ
jgi:hypothetical protein